MKSLLSRIWPHIKRFREAYGYLPLALLSLFLFSAVVRLSLGHKPLDDISDLTGVSENFIKIILAIVATGFVKGHLLTDLTDEETKQLPKWRVILDSSETLILLCVFVFAFFWR